MCEANRIPKNLRQIFTYPVTDAPPPRSGLNQYLLFMLGIGTIQVQCSTRSNFVEGLFFFYLILS